MLTRKPPVTGTPRWAVVCAWLTIACVLPSGIWRTAVGLGVPLGWSQAHLDLERIPGYGTSYVISLTVLSLAAASLTLGLVHPWGERVPFLGDRAVPVAVPVALAVAGAVVVAGLVVLGVVHWSDVSGFADRPGSGWALVMVACYLPATAWAPLLLAVTWAYVRRRGQAFLPQTGQAP